ncbi:MAG: NUDIX hydrolase [Thermus sp.]
MGGVSRTYLYRGRILNLALEGRYEIVEHKPAVAVLALKEGKMLFVRQPRPAVGLAPLEIPAGLMEAGESPLEAAKRELAEEAGLTGDLSYLFSFYVSPGFTDEKTHVFLAENLREAQATPDEDEAIEVVWLEPEKALEMHRRGEAEFSATGIVGVLYYHAFLRGC